MNQLADQKMNSRLGMEFSFSGISKIILSFIWLGFLVLPAVARAWERVPGQFVVKLKGEQNFFGTEALEQNFQARIIEQIRPNIILIHRLGPEEPDAALKLLRKSNYVELVEPNYIYRINRTPNDPDYGLLWGLRNLGELDSKGSRGLRGVDLNAELAWDTTTGSKDVVVAIIDTGIDFSIPDLKNNAWVNKAEAKGTRGVDDDQNGYVDDINGYDFASNDSDPTDDHGHGSHCAGTIGAEGNDGRGLVGVNWNVSLMAIKFMDAKGGGSLSAAVKSIDYARKMGAKILNNSWGGGAYSEILKQVIDETRLADQVFIAASGNESANTDRTPVYPASYGVDNIISVAAIDNRGELAYFSNYGFKSVHLAAPGVNILSTVPGGTDTHSGTSMAAPHVSGVAALLVAENPNQTYSQIKQRLLSYVRPVRSLQGKVKTGGMVDAYYALTGRQPPPDPYDPSAWSGSEPYEVSSPHPYPFKWEQTYTVKKEGVKRISVRFSKFETESGYDRVQFFNSQGESLGIWSGKQSGRYAPIAEGDTLVMKFTTDGTVPGYGFDIDQVVFELE